LGLALFYGDGMLTPAICVLSAVEEIAIDNATAQIAGGAADAGDPDRAVRGKAMARTKSGGCSGR
jgi:hypothetical protein